MANLWNEKDENEISAGMGNDDRDPSEREFEEELAEIAFLRAEKKTY